MKAAQINQYGGEEVLKVAEAPKPSAGKGEVLVEVYAAALNPFDYKVREGYMKEFIPLQFPATLGGDCSGVIAEIGEGVEGFEVGQSVYGMANAAGGQGSYAEFTAVKVKQLANKPRSLDDVTAAALPLAASSAYQAIIDEIDIQPNQKILIHGGAGGIGAFAIQFAKQRGAYVATTAGADDIKFAKSLGADEVIDYKNQDFSELLKDYDAVFDTVGGETNSKSYQVLKPGGKLVSMVEEPEDELVEKYQVEAKVQSTQATAERLKSIAELADSGKLSINVDKVFPLEEAGEALEYLKSGHSKGKVVIKVKD